jgi:hypothetical protein
MMNYAFYSKRPVGSTPAGIVVSVQDLADDTAARAARDLLGPFYGYMSAAIRVLAVGDQTYPTDAVLYHFHWKMEDGSAGDLINSLMWIAPTAPTDDNPDGTTGAGWPLDVSQSRVIATLA